MPEAQVGGGHAPHERTVGAGDDLFEQRCRIAQGISPVERPGAALMVETVVDALPDGIQFIGGEQVAECDSAAGVLFVTARAQSCCISSRWSMSAGTFPPANNLAIRRSGCIRLSRNPSASIQLSLFSRFRYSGAGPGFAAVLKKFR